MRYGACDGSSSGDAAHAPRHTSRAVTARVLQLFQPSEGGVPAYVHGLAVGLRQREWDVIVACDPAADVAAQLREDGVPTAPFIADRGPSARDASALSHLTALVRRERPALIHTHSSKAGLLGGAVGRAFRIPTLYTPHGWSFQMDGRTSTRRLFAGVEGVLGRVAHRYIIAVCVSERDAALAHHVATPDSVIVVRTGRESQRGNPIDRDAVRGRLGIHDARPIAAWVGRAGRQKGAAALPAIAAMLAQGGVVLAALGTGLRQSGIASAIEQAGGVAVPASVSANELLSAADILLSTSNWEGLPLVVIEALERAMPIVAYDVGGLSEQVVRSINGHLVPIGDQEALVDHASAIAHDPATSRRLGAASRQIWTERYRPETMLDRIELIYADVLRHR